MKRFNICILLITVMCISFSSCIKINSASEESLPSKNETVQNINSVEKLTVNGEEISCGNALSINPKEKYAEIPLISTLKALGCEVEWVNNKIEIVHNGILYILNPNKKTLFKSGESFNIIAIAPGATHGVYCKISDEEFIIDSDSISYFLSLLGADLAIDYGNNTVKITCKAK